MKVEGFSCFTQDIQAEVKKIVGPGWFSCRETDRLMYARDMMTPQVLRMRAGEVEQIPDLVVWPQTERQIIELLALAQTLRLPIVPYGCGSGVCGGTLPLGGGLVMDIKHLNRVLKLDETSCTVEAEAGIIGEHLERELNHRGFTMGHSPSSIYCSTLGGYLATRSAGQLSAFYGKIEDMAVRFRVITTNGKVHDLTVGAQSAPGVDLGSLFMGSEGTMGVITSAVMRVHRLPESRRFRGILFSSLSDGLRAVRLLLQKGLNPVALRLYDEFDTMLVGTSGKGEGIGAALPLAEISKWFKPLAAKLYQGGEAFLLGKPELLTRIERWVPRKCLLILSFEGPEALTLAAEQAALTICQIANGRDLGPDPGEKWWNNRYHVSYLASKVYENGSFVDTMEVATTWDKLEPLYHEVRRKLSSLVFIMAHFSHAYRSGCSIYFTFVGHRAKLEQAIDLHSSVWQQAMEVITGKGATITHHHGVGLLKQEWLPAEFGLGLNVIRSCKTHFDPDAILNKGKLGL